MKLDQHTRHQLQHILLPAFLSSLTRPISHEQGNVHFFLHNSSIFSIH